MESPAQNAPRLTVQDPLAAAGAVVLDCRPPLLPVSMDITDVDLSAIQTSSISARAGAFPREQSFVGGDLLSLICPKLGATPLADPGTDLEDELPTPATSPVTVDHGAGPRSAQADVDSDLVRIFEDVGTLPAMVTPLSDPEGGLLGSPAGYAVPVIADASDRTTQPLVVTSPAGPTDMDPAIPRPSTVSMSCSAVLSSLPVVSATEWSPSSRTAPVDQQWSGSLFGGELAGHTMPPGSLTSHPTAASPHVSESDAVGGGGTWVSQTCLESAPLMSIRTVRSRVHRRACWMTRNFR